MSKPESRSPEDILRKPYARILIPAEDGTYTAEVLEFLGCYAEGDTPDEAIANLESAAVSWIEAALEQGQEIPPPVAAYGYSGKINLRLPKSLHRQAASFAQRDDVSLNQFFISAIAARVGAEALYEHLARKLEDTLMFAVHVVNVQQFWSNQLFWFPGIPAAEITYQSAPTALERPPQNSPVFSITAPQHPNKVSTNG